MRSLHATAAIDIVGGTTVFPFYDLESAAIAAAKLIIDCSEPRHPQAARDRGG